MSEYGSFFKTGISSGYLIGSIILTVVAIICGLLTGRVKDKTHYVIWELFVEYILVVICSTIVFRPEFTDALFPRLQLSPFWTYRAVLSHTIGVSVWDIVLNVVLFVPFGFFVALLFPKSHWGQILLGALVFSFSIEMSQYILSKGISQFDDLMHNLLGCAIGTGLSRLILNKIRHINV